MPVVLQQRCATARERAQLRRLRPSIRLAACVARDRPVDATAVLRVGRIEAAARGAIFVEQSRVVRSALHRGRARGAAGSRGQTLRCFRNSWRTLTIELEWPAAPNHDRSDMTRPPMCRSPTRGGSFTSKLNKGSSARGCSDERGSSAMAPPPRSDNARLGRSPVAAGTSRDNRRRQGLGASARRASLRTHGCDCVPDRSSWRTTTRTMRSDTAPRNRAAAAVHEAPRHVGGIATTKRPRPGAVTCRPARRSCARSELLLRVGDLVAGHAGPHAILADALGAQLEVRALPALPRARGSAAPAADRPARSGSSPGATSARARNDPGRRNHRHRRAPRTGRAPIARPRRGSNRERQERIPGPSTSVRVPPAMIHERCRLRRRLHCPNEVARCPCDRQHDRRETRPERQQHPDHEVLAGDEQDDANVMKQAIDGRARWRRTRTSVSRRARVGRLQFAARRSR